MAIVVATTRVQAQGKCLIPCNTFKVWCTFCNCKFFKFIIRYLMVAVKYKKKK